MILDRLTSAPPNEEFLTSAVDRLLSLSYSTIILPTFSNSKVECCSSTKYLPVIPSSSDREEVSVLGRLKYSVPEEVISSLIPEPPNLYFLEFI